MNVRSIDTRDLEAEIDELEALDARDNEQQARLATLVDLRAEVEDYAGDSFADGVQLIHKNDFTDYAEDLAEEMGLVDTTNMWPLYCIDWERAARDLAVDYTTCELDGVTYLYR